MSEGQVDISGGAAPGPPGPGASPDRVVAFSDGVFAIVITILVLEIVVPPDLSEQSLREALDEVGATLVAWVVSFLLTGMYWVAHRDLFSRVRAVNRDLVWLNLLFLLPVCLIPFAASVLGEYPDVPLALRLYGTVVIGVTLMRAVLHRYLVRRPHLLWEPPPTRMRLVALLGSAPLPVYLVAVLVAGIAPSVSVALFFSVPVLYFVLVSILRSRPSTKAAADEFS